MSFPHTSVGKESTFMQVIWVQSLGWEDPLEKGDATHSSILALRLPWTVWKGKKIWHWKMDFPGR